MKESFSLCQCALLFKAPQHRVVIEGAALHHDLAAQLGGVGNLDDLEEGVFDHGIGQPRRDVGDAGQIGRASCRERV